ncbi:lysine-specific demethylase 7B-like isoform X2 [Littorina saxatilis]|uniref:lysine-specific demethylase 7B-like isoform X2 n=1 Tax=Littorina saxatilis TaxID=31220 RepID=UPI0038B4C0A2
MASDAETLYCLCRKPYDETQFMIECDKCQDWYHGSCVNVQEHQAADIEYYHCPDCEKYHGPLVLKTRYNFHRHDYSEQDDGKAVQTGTPVFMKELKSRTFPNGDEVVKRLSGPEVTPEYFNENGFDAPILVEKKDGLGLRVPPPDISIEEIERRVGPMRELDVIDVARQEDHKMLMRHWTEYYNSPERHKILNVISLEFSKTALSELVDPPRVVKQVSWVSNLWPEDMPDEMVPDRPEVQKYCLMGVKDSFTDFHVDFGGTSVWYHVVRGEKVFFIIRPTETNLGLFENWLSSSTQSETFFGDQVDRCWRAVVKKGQTLFIPSGWIHAVLTPIDSLVFGGNFLHNYNIPLQLEAYEIERRVKTPEKYLFPSYETVNWYAAKHILDILKACTEDGTRPPDYIIEGTVALAQHLKKWTQRKDYTRRRDAPGELEGIQYGKLIRELNAEVKQWDVQKSPSKSPRKTEKTERKAEKKSGKKKKKKEQAAPKEILGLDLLHQHTEDRLKSPVIDKKELEKIYNFEDDEDEAPAPTMLKVRIPKPGALVDKQQDQKLPPIKLGALAKPPDTKKTKHKKGSGGKKNKKGAAVAAEKKKKEEEVKEEEMKEEEEVEVGDNSEQKQPVAPFKFRVSNGKFVQPSGSKGAAADTKPVGFQLLVPPAVKEEDEDSDKDDLVVDETPGAAVSNRKSTTIKPGSLRVKLSIGEKGKEEIPPELAKQLGKEGSLAWRLQMPTIRGGLNGSIADILEASGYGTETAFKVDDDVLTSPTSQSQMLAIEGMLSMSQGSRSNPLFAPLSQGVFRPGAMLKGGVKDEEEQLMADCYQDGEYMYPSFELSDDEQLGSKPKVQEKDDNWNPKARVAVPTKGEERSHRVGVKNQAIASGLAATAKKLSEAPPVPKKLGKKSPGGKGKIVETEFEVKPLPGPSTDFMGAGSAFRPGVKRAVDNTPATPPPKPKKPKKGQATAKQRLGKILKIKGIFR